MPIARFFQPNPIYIHHDGLVQVDIEITYPKFSRELYCVKFKKIIDNLERIEVLNFHKDKLYEETKSILGWIEFVSHHKCVYEGNFGEVTDEFILYAGNYDYVVKRLNHYRELYDTEYVQPSSKIYEEISNITNINNTMLSELGVYMDWGRSFIGGRTHKMFKIRG